MPYSTPAVVVFSGGQDSTTVAVKALYMHDEVHLITFDYGQRHKLEVEVAKDIMKKFQQQFPEKKLQMRVVNADIIGAFTPTALTDAGIEVAHGKEGELPNTFVPGRNIAFLTFASMYAYQVGAKHIYTGVCETDYSGYPDCRQNFVNALNKAINLGMDTTMAIVTPLMYLDKADTWALADRYGMLDFVRENTLTCYNGIVGDGCGTCPSCELRKKGLNEYNKRRATQ